MVIVDFEQHFGGEVAGVFKLKEKGYDLPVELEEVLDKIGR
jgi:hypothetical protein